jgi:hypothetical protein
MDQSGAKFLAGPALTLNKHRDIGLGDHFQLSPDHLHLGCAAEKDFHRREIELCFVLREANSSHIFLSSMLASSPRNGQSIRRATYLQHLGYFVLST